MRNLLRPVFALLFALLPTACTNLNFYSDEELEPVSQQAYEEATASTGGRITSGPQYEMVQRVAQKIGLTLQRTVFKNGGDALSFGADL
jgi:hypothetical protein